MEAAPKLVEEAIRFEQQAAAYSFPTIFLDRSVESRSIADALSEAGIDVRKHSDYFADDAPDDEWLTRAGDEGWIVLHKDKMIRRRRNERDALLAAGVKAFVITVRQHAW